MSHLKKLFKNPPKEFSIVPLIRVNDDIPKEEFAFQLEDMKRKGIHGVFFYTEKVNLFLESVGGIMKDERKKLGKGIPYNYMSKKWWSVFDFILKKCKKLGMKLWIYDEEDWPSGNCGQNGGKVVKGRPDLIGRPLIWKEIRLLKNVRIREDCISAVVYKKSGESIDEDSLKSVKTSQDINSIPKNGKWFLAYYKTGAKYGFDVDVLNPEALQRFVKSTHYEYARRYKKYLGKTIPGSFTDEPNIRRIIYRDVGLPWTEKLPEVFMEKKGYDILQFLPLLTGKGGKIAVKIRNDYWDIINQMFINAYFKPIYEWGEKFKVSATGHLLGEENFYWVLTYMGNIYSILRHFQLPGMDWVMPFKEVVPPYLAKMVSSVAHITNRKRVMSETFAGSGWGLNFEQMKWMTNWQYVFGVNMLVPISYKISFRGMERAKFFPPGISYQQPYWEHFKYYADYVSRLGFLSSQGQHIARAAVLYPITEIWANSTDKEKINGLHKDFLNITNSLVGNQIDFEMLDDKAIQESSIEKSKMRVNKESYDVVVIPVMKTIKKLTLRKLMEFKKSGGNVVFIKVLPSASPEIGEDDPEIISLVGGLKAVSINNLIRTVRSAIVPDIEVFPKKDFYYQHRIVDNKKLYYLYNNSKNCETFKIKFNNIKGMAEIWDPETGKLSEPQNCRFLGKNAILNIPFGPFQSVFVIFDAGRRQKNVNIRTTTRKVINVIGKWKFKAETNMLHPNIKWNFEDIDDGKKAPKEIGLGQWNKYRMPYFSGKGIYEKEIVLKKADIKEKVFLDLGDVGISAKVFVNGKEAGIRVWMPYKFDLTGLLKAGENKLRIEVCNTLAEHYNQYRELRGKHLGFGGVVPEQLKAGLIGPVQLMIR